MAINTDTILASFISIAQIELVGIISESGPSAGPKTPSVIKARQKGTRPDFPYVQLDITGMSDTSGYSLGVSTDSDTFEVLYDTHKKIGLQYVVYGGNATLIAETLATAFSRDFIVDKISTETGGELEQVFAVDTVPSNLSTEMYDVASVSLTFNINNRYVDSDIGVFDTIGLTGELKQHIDDSSPQIMEVSLTSNSLP